MPDPKNYMDGRHTYVRGYVRRKRKNNYDNKLGCILMIIIASSIAIYFLWKILLPIAIIVILIYIWRIERN